MTLKQFWQEERANRQRSKWFEGRFWVINNHGVPVDVAIKSFGLFNQLLYINGSAINYCTGHTCNTVGQMRKEIESILDSASAPEKTAKPQQA
jgi:hypothetical protein